ncbi:MAG TPA: DinB family protein [Chitinophagaceae bacterium]|nr:DinB family protein [Chitinophagaceae bacterium]
MPIEFKPQLISALNEKIDAFNNYIESLSKEQFEETRNGKWSAGQNLDHLIRSIRPLQVAYRLPKFALLILFGKTNRPSRTYDEVVTKYKTKLTAGGKASGPFIPPFIGFEKKEALIRKYKDQKQKLIAKVEKQAEKDLDTYILPHPLLGKVTLREMLFFTIHHNEHHLELLKNRV